MSVQIIRVRSREREQFIDITDEVERRLREAGAREGICYLYVQHTTAGLTINESADPDVARDMLYALRRLAPQHDANYRHGEGNTDAHIKSSLMGTSVSVPFSDGRLLLGRWQGIFLCEFDGPRERQIIMMIR
ncbi:secondary thiamine-phosphate synthase enzyme YjbQ [Pyrinomonas methylaliphatogenes]|jgi:secondary thiamine-phosphate synthase enzyme|uniref:Secondary thiamine-phosphate synthase enzyme n=1 Tax=Pyrinomonas methylaliphatogenes TaxID=454194 RepID=A0A0B6X1L8_9BACT|nr:secondary thiamine-phosphate synthase enzyme YjbQ [Pyrinomonas methylaliphatogenes]MBX5478139.1 YjbQ family protein [Pyrinomonas methylaliphatogenes]CDM66454.1 secondary thiamine-phosphate synthase enzyme [Pyrinomonas methylaliphatogenes]